MSIRVDAYTSKGIATRVVERPGALRDLLEPRRLTLTRASWRSMGAPGRSGPSRTDPPDRRRPDRHVADDDPFIAIHAVWHPVRLEIGSVRARRGVADAARLRPGPCADPADAASSSCCATSASRSCAVPDRTIDGPACAGQPLRGGSRAMPTSCSGSSSRAPRWIRRPPRRAVSRGSRRRRAGDAGCRDDV